MDNAVALVQAFLRLHGFLTVTEFPIVQVGRHGGHECLTDLDVLAFRFGEAGGSCHEEGRPRAPSADSLLGIDPGVPDMIIGEVKEGRAELNAAATRHEVLAAALARFGCCARGDIDPIATELLRHGHTRTHHGHLVRLVAFGTLPPGHRDPRCHVILLHDVIEHIRAYVRHHWDAILASGTKDPGLSMLITLEKAARGRKQSESQMPSRLPP